MSTKRMRPSGTWEYIIRRKGILPKPLSLTFDTEEEGDAYVRRLKQMLDAGILPEDIVARRSDLVTADDAIRAYMTKVSLPNSDRLLLNALVGHWRDQSLTKVDYQWADLGQEDSAAVRSQGKEPKEDIHRDLRLPAEREAAVRRILAGEKPANRQRSPDLNFRPAMVFLFELAIESAMRMREMYTLDLSQVDVARRTVFLDKTKNGSKRQVPLTTVAIWAFEDYVDTVRDQNSEMDGFSFDGGRLFPWWDGSCDRKVLAGVSVRLSQQFATDLRRCGIRRVQISRSKTRSDVATL